MAGRDSSSLNPALLDRLRALAAPDWIHTVAARRWAAAALVLLAAAAALRPDPAADLAPALVATRDLTPGTALTPTDVRLEYRRTGQRPDGTLQDPAAVIGAGPAGVIRRGEVLTDVRLLGTRLAEAGAGPDARMVPIRLADARVADLVRPGDLVDVIAAPTDEHPAPRVLAADAVVVLVPEAPANTAADGRVVLIALPAAAAQRVAATALAESVTVTLH